MLISVKWMYIQSQTNAEQHVCFRQSHSQEHLYSLIQTHHQQSHMLIQTYLDRLSPTWIIKGGWRVAFYSQSTHSLRGRGIDFKRLIQVVLDCTFCSPHSEGKLKIQCSKILKYILHKLFLVEKKFAAAKGPNWLQNGTNNKARSTVTYQAHCDSHSGNLFQKLCCISSETDKKRSRQTVIIE